MTAAGAARALDNYPEFARDGRGRRRQSVL
jgi:hypothetical protein